jgi:hypothetical protein
MIALTSLHASQAANDLLRQLSLGSRMWIARQAEQIVGSRRYGFIEEMRLREAIRWKLQSLTFRSPAEADAVNRIFTFLVLSQTMVSWEGQLKSIGDDAQLANIDLQNALQKQQQLLQMLSNISKEMSDTAMSTIRKIG